MSFIQLSWLVASIERLGSVLRFALFTSAAIFLSNCPAVAADSAMTACKPVVSPDQRLRMEQWAADGHCASPMRTRVTDRYLGFACVKEVNASTTCRSYLPVSDSRTFGTGKYQHCFDAAVTATDGEYTVNRVREWVTTEPSKCEWDPYMNLLAVEMDLENARVCIEDVCIPITELSVTGRLRLVRAILKAFNQPS